MTENKEDRLWLVEETIIKRYMVSAPTAGDAVLVPRTDPFFVDKIQVRATLKNDIDDRE